MTTANISYESSILLYSSKSKQRFSQPCHSDVLSVAKVYVHVYKKKALCNPHDSRSGALSVGPGVVNDSPFGALS